MAKGKLLRKETEFWKGKKGKKSMFVDHKEREREREGVRGSVRE